MAPSTAWAEGDGRVAEHVHALPAECLVRLHHDGDQQVAGAAAVFAGVALAPQRDGLAVVDAGGDVDLDGLAFPHPTLSAAVGTGLMDNAAGAVTLLAGTAGGKHAHRRPLLHLHLAAAAAIGADLRRGPRLAAAALAGSALLATLHGHVLLAAEGRLPERHGHAGADALAPLGRVGVTALLAAKAAAEKSCRRYRPDRRSRSRPHRHTRRRLRPRRSWDPRPRSRTGRTGPFSPGRTAPRWPR